MRALEPQTRFLLRGSALLLGLLTLWWFVLASPMLYLLKGAAAAFMETDEHPSGDWTLRVPLEMVLPATAQEPLARQVRSVDFDIPRGDAITFTFSLPLLWAILLAANCKPRPLLWGTIVMALIEVALLLVFAQITAREGVSQLAGTDDAVSRWMRHVGTYLTVNVLPYIAPFLVALTVHRELRHDVFSRGRTEQYPFRWACIDLFSMSLLQGRFRKMRRATCGELPSRLPPPNPR